MLALGPGGSGSLKSCSVGAMDSARLVYAPWPSVTPEQERAALASIYAFIKRNRGKAAGTSGGENDAKGPNEHDRAKQIVQQ